MADLSSFYFEYNHEIFRDVVLALTKLAGLAILLRFLSRMRSRAHPEPERSAPRSGTAALQEFSGMHEGQFVVRETGMFYKETPVQVDNKGSVSVIGPTRVAAAWHRTVELMGWRELETV
ncbi:hypothetical protein BV25DRAFT_1914873 [Artomyces pyxidatus]|uniref:Uncharacterized protein n=1 Tax=Artomyces pyxidatus TaxID=48021 RepID=A0ACB8T769_9AGAM|nr:hypothetical protein BV25DRAFT_1914873 [Artomyces pyxidatus]